MSSKIMNIIRNSIALFLGLWTIIMLSFSLVYFKLPDILSKIYEYDELRKLNNNGFSFMGFKSNIFIDDFYIWVIALVGTFSIIFLLVGIAGLVVSVLRMTNVIRVSKPNSTIIIIEIVCMFLYMLGGIVLSSVANIAHDSVNFKTVAFVPFIIGAIFAIVYAILPSCFSKLVSENTRVPIIKGSRQLPKPIQSNAIDIAEELRKYKLLIDEGLINQEDYEKKKAQLLDTYNNL